MKLASSLNTQKNIAYFSMEIAIDKTIPTYSGGLGILAGDTIRSAADLAVPMVAVTLLYKKGYLRQVLDQDGHQKELPEEWDPSAHIKLLPHKISVTIENRKIHVQAWEYIITGINNYSVPVILLDTDIEQNSPDDRQLTYYLYGGDQQYRLAQEIILGIGGVRMLNTLGYTTIDRYHMNEGHSSLLTLELLKETNKDPEKWDHDRVKRKCVFTTHTPVPAGMDQFPYDLVGRMLGQYIPVDRLKQLCCQDSLNMTLLALTFSHYENGVAKSHRSVAQHMFPGYRIDSITNGVHSGTWVCEEFARLYDKYIAGWRNDPFSLRYALNIPEDEVMAAHVNAKRRLFEYIKNKINIDLAPNVFTIGFARRATGYKRADLIFYDMERLINITREHGPIQLIFAGKAHPADYSGKDLIKKIIDTANKYQDKLKIVYLENYDFTLAGMLVSGVDCWLNTPQKPREASGTSGMKAAHNGVPSFSILDGWWIEGCIEGYTGWAIGSLSADESNDRDDAYSLYEKLERVILPGFYQNGKDWVNIMRHSIAINAAFFNTHRMLLQYVLNAYLE
ncbi:MAG: alpha-glucan family phosphorylase [Candidatus Margulisiibacteriota bacterium]